MSAFVLLGAALGAVLGLVDTLDTVLGGFTASMSLAATAVFVLAGCALQAAFGAVLGLGLSGASVIARRAGVGFDPARGLSLGRRTLSPHAVLAVVGAGTIAVLCGSMWWFLGDYPFGFGAAILLPVVAVAAALAFGFALLATRRYKLASVALWCLTGAILWFIEARLIYQFSKQGSVPILHAIGLVGLYVFAFLAVASAAPRLWKALGRTRRPAVVAATVCSVLLLLGARPLLGLGSNQLRLALHERTSLTYRLLELLPSSDYSPHEAWADAGCPPDEPVARVRSDAALARPLRGVIVIMVDSLRADHVRPDLTPNMMRFADGATSFSRAYTVAPSTYYATRSMLSGRFFERGLDEAYERNSLGPLLTQQGVRTVAVAAHENLWYAVNSFDVYDQFEEDISNRSSLTSEDTVVHVNAQLDALDPDQRFFLFAHFYDPHAHYVGNDLFESGRSELERYAAEVEYTDHWIGELLDDLDERGSSDDVAVMIVSDHGDEFWEHRYSRHLLRLYDESVRVVMMLRVPGGSPRLVETPVSVMDIAPTVLDLFDFAIPDSVEAHSLLPVALGVGPAVDRPVFLQSYYDRSSAIVRGDKKLIVNEAIGVTEYYDLAQDPAEQNNLGDSPTREYSELYCSLTGWMAEHDR